MAALNPGQFKGTLYHGTTHDIVGKDIVPHAVGVHDNSMWGDTGHSGQKSSEHAFATEKEDVAWKFANSSGISARWIAQRDREAGQTVPEPGRVRVHTVASNPQMTKGVYHKDSTSFGRNGAGNDDHAEWRAPAFRVKDRVDIQPGRQGTFPSLNWNQFRAPGVSNPGMEANHPTDENIQEGHEPRWDRGDSAHKEWTDKRSSRAYDEMSKETGVIPRGHETSVVSHDQMDLLSGRTVQDHAENDESALGDYHRNALFGRL